MRILKRTGFWKAKVFETQVNDFIKFTAESFRVLESPETSDDNVGIGQTYMENNLLKSKARIYNTSTFPDMVKRIRLGLVRDVSIEGMVSNFKKICNGDGCWQRAFGLLIQRAVFVHAGADPHARIERILESLEGDLKNMTDKKTGKSA